MPRLAIALATNAFPTLRRLKTCTIAGRWFEGIARCAANPHQQACQLCRYGGELGAERLDFLLMSQDECFNDGWVASQSASEIPEDGAAILSGLVLRRKLESHRSQGFNQIKVSCVPSRPMNG
jgi:hypothetical protein